MPGKKGADLPEPAWWARARKLFHQEGYNKKQIARILGKSDQGVRHALYPQEKREYLKQYRVQRREKDTRKRVIDCKRQHARAEARFRWRNEQYRRPLEAYYRELECL